MKRIFSCSSSQVAVEKWNRRDQKLLEAVQRGDVSRVAALASRKNARPTKLDSHGQSPFHLAASKGLTECLSVLLANGAEINSKNEDGSTALHLATISCQPQCVKVLLQHGANEDAVDGENRSPLHWAASSGCASSVLLLCDHEAFLDVLDNDGRTPLMIASLGGHAAICSQLLQRGARVNVTDKEDKSALILACEKGSAEVAEMLLSHGADVGTVDIMGHDALYYALRTQDEELWRLLRQALNRRQRGGQELAQHPDSASQGSPPKSPRRAEAEEDEDEKEEEGEDLCSPQEWRKKYEAEKKKVSQLEQELIKKAQECKAQESACQSLESRVREQVQELGVLLARESRAPGGQGSSPRPGGDGMEQGCVLDLLAEQVQELKRQKEAMRLKGSESRGPQGESQGTTQAEEQRPQLLSPAGKAPRKAKGEKVVNVGGVVSSQGRGDQVLPLKEERGKALGAEPAGMVALGQLLLQLREELTAVWRDKDAARGVLGRPAGNRVWGASQAEAAAAAWEKMEARLEQVLARLDRAKAGLNVEAVPPILGSPEGGPLPQAKAITGMVSPTREGKAKEERAHETRGEPLGAPGAGQAPEGPGGKGQLEKEVSALRLSNSNLLEELSELGRERQRLQGELQALGQRLQKEYMPRPEAQGQLQQLRSSVGLLAEELAAEKEAAEQLRRRLAAQSTGLQGLRECLPPNLVGGGSLQGPAPDPLEELQGCVGALVAKYNEAQRELAKLEGENRRLKGNGPVASRAVPQVAALEQDLGKLEEELRAVQATMGGKSQEIGKLKHLLYQATEEVAELRAREAANLKQQEKSRASLVAQAQTWGQELKALLEKYNSACRETGQLREVVAEERRRSRELAARAAEQERRASEMRGRSEQFERAGEILKEKMEQLIGACREKEAKIRELLKKLEQMSAEVLAVRGENTRLRLQLQDSQKNHQEIISTYRNHLLNAAQGYMEQDVYKILLRILKMQE